MQDKKYEPAVHISLIPVRAVWTDGFPGGQSIGIDFEVDREACLVALGEGFVMAGGLTLRAGEGATKEQESVDSQDEPHVIGTCHVWPPDTSLGEDSPTLSASCVIPEDKFRNLLTEIQNSRLPSYLGVTVRGMESIITPDGFESIEWPQPKQPFPISFLSFNWKGANIRPSLVELKAEHSERDALVAAKRKESSEQFAQYERLVAGAVSALGALIGAQRGLLRSILACIAVLVVVVFWRSCRDS